METMDAPNTDIKPGQGGRLVYDKARRTIVAAPVKARPLSEWHEDMGSVLWWAFPIDEPPYVGTPYDLGQTVETITRHYVGAGEVKETTSRTNVGGWPGYHTHWTPLPAAPTA